MGVLVAVWLVERSRVCEQGEFLGQAPIARFSVTKGVSEISLT
jgi:hypothetical protein